MLLHLLPLVAAVLAVPLSPQLVARAQPVIPVLGFGVIADPSGYAGRLLASIDHAVERIVVVYGGRSDGADETWHSLWRLHGQHENVTLVQVTEGLGCAESWNHITAIAPTAPWVVVTAYDIAFLPGQLAKLAQQYEADLQVEWVPVSGYANRLVAAARQKTPELMAHIDLKEDGASIGTDYNLFAISRPMLQRLGSFDENIWPAYFEDNEWCHRMLLAYGAWPDHNGHRIWYRSEATTCLKIYSGAAATLVLKISACLPQPASPASATSQEADVQGIHGGLIGWKQQSSAANTASASYFHNEQYYQQKWGCTGAGEESCSFQTPWNKPNAALGHWEFDGERRRRLGGLGQSRVMHVHEPRSQI
eukprot:jgi/Astpho2/7202/fgenesh1_pg.00113_%23_37_t